MRILIMDDFSTRSGGAEHYRWNLQHLLEEKGHEVSTFFHAHRPRLRVFGSIFSFGNLIRSYRAIKELGPDIIHINKCNLALSISPLISARILKKKVVFTFHDFGSICANGWCLDKDGRPCKNPTSIRWVFKASLSHKNTIKKFYDYLKNRIHLSFLKAFCDIYIGPSSTMTSYLQDIFGREKIVHIPYFIDEKWKFKKKTGINKKLLFIGRLEKEKGIEYLVEALRYCDPEISLDIIGTGPEEDRIKALVAQLEIKNRVYFRGKIPNNKLQRYYHLADLIIMPSIWMEQFGIVGIEAMASGTPGIASDLGGTKDWLKNGKNGILVQPGKPGKIAEAINRIVNHPHLLVRFSQEGIKIFRKNFTKEIHYQKIMQAYSNRK